MCKTAFCFEIYLSFSLSCSRFWPSVSEVATWNLHFSWGTFAKRIQDQLYICARHRFHGTVININTCQRIFTLETHVGKEKRKIVFEKWIYIYISNYSFQFFLLSWRFSPSIPSTLILSPPPRVTSFEFLFQGIEERCFKKNAFQNLIKCKNNISKKLWIILKESELIFHRWKCRK